MANNRKTNLESMPHEAIENLAEQTGIKINTILLKAKRDCSKLLNRMGLDIELNYEIKIKQEVPQLELDNADKIVNQ